MNQSASQNPSLLIERVLTLRKSRRERAHLRRANVVSTRHYALPLLGSYLDGRNDEAAYRFAALCAGFDTIKQKPELSIGKALRLSLSDPKKVDSGGPIEKRLFAMQRQPLQRADTTLRSALNIAEPSSLDWGSVYWLLRGWDHTDLTKRVNNRQKILQSFYTYVPSRRRAD